MADLPTMAAEPIGRGGMGDVWRAERSDGRFESQVAIKLLNGALKLPSNRILARPMEYCPGVAR